MMIALTHKMAFPRFEYLLESTSSVDEVIFLEYENGSLLIDDKTIDNLKSDSAIILIDNLHLNYTKIELYAKLRLAGIKFGNLISPNAAISASVKIGENVIIHHGVKIEGSTILMSAVELQENTILKDHCSLGRGVSIGHHSYISSNVRIGSNVNIGNYITVAKDVMIGSNVALEEDYRSIKSNVPSGTFYGEPFQSVYRYI